MSAILYFKERTAEVAAFQAVLDQAKATFLTVQVGQDMLNEDFLSIFPSDRLPFVTMNGQKFNSYGQLSEHLGSQPTTLFG